MLGPSGTGKPGFLLGLSETGRSVLGPSEAGPDFLLGLSETGVPVLGPLSGTDPPSDTRAVTGERTKLSGAVRDGHASAGPIRGYSGLVHYTGIVSLDDGASAGAS